MPTLHNKYRWEKILWKNQKIVSLWETQLGMTASMRSPMPGEYVEVYVYLTAKIMKQRGKELEIFMTEKLEKGLTQYEERTLLDLKADIFRKRGGEIDSPLLNAMRAFKKEVNRKKDDPQLSLL